jgi:antirestriction protein ArdC
MANYQKIADVVLAAMDTEAKWRKTWTEHAGLQRNFLSKRPYSGANQLSTMITAHVSGYTSPFWMTFNQCKELGGNLKGQKGTPVMFFGGNKDKETGKEYKFGKAYTVFNLEQTGIEIPEPELRETLLMDPYDVPRALVVDVIDGSPSYNLLTDKIKMPMPGYFESDDAFKATLYHECIHSTGAKKRLDRPMDGMFGSEEYAKEELVAELGSIFLCASLNIPYELEQHASYLKSWTRAIKDDSNYLVTAVRQAQKAADYVLSQVDLMEQQDAA